MKVFLSLILFIPSVSFAELGLKYKVLGCGKIFKNLEVPSRDYYYFKSEKQLFSLMLPIGWDDKVLMVSRKYEITPTKILIYNSFENEFESEIDRQSGKYINYYFNKEYNCRSYNLDFNDEHEFKKHLQELFDMVNEDIVERNKF